MIIARAQESERGKGFRARLAGTCHGGFPASAGGGLVVSTQGLGQIVVRHKG